MLTPACGPSGDLFFFLVIGGPFLVFLTKPLLYWLFVSAFRFRIAGPVPMRMRQTFTIVLARMIFGACQFFTWLAVYGVSHTNVASTWPWILSVCLRLVIWCALGAVVARLRGRRLVGWTITGTLVDAAFDASVFIWTPGTSEQLTVVGALVVFLFILRAFGRRPSLVNRFTQSPRCSRCGYDLTGNLSGACPECNQSVQISIREVQDALGPHRTPMPASNS